MLRSIPSSALSVEPAASIVDVESAIKRCVTFHDVPWPFMPLSPRSHALSHTLTPSRRCDPRLLLFSGHSFAGSLAFELPNGRIELPPPEMFISKVCDLHDVPTPTAFHDLR